MKIKKSLEIFLMLIVLSSFAYAAGTATHEMVGVADVTVCCEKTNSGLYCQDVLESECAGDSDFALPTACESTGPCDPGYCYDEEEGTCLDNVPQMVCNKEGGAWSATKPKQCDLGCCILGDQASFVTGIRCKKLSSYYGLTMNYNPDIQDESQCILAARSNEEGACVFEGEFGETTCKRITRSQCTTDMTSTTVSTTSSSSQTTTTTANNSENNSLLQSPGDGCTMLGDKVKFCAGMLCSAPELDTNCGKSQETTCADGKEEVYFLDSCGNLANIYDASKVKDDNYWTYIVDKMEACKGGQDNINSPTCGNCNYLKGSFCGATSGSVRPTYGSNVCIDLNCPASDETGGRARLHGESWCGFDRQRDFSWKENYQNVFTDLFQEALKDVKSKKSISNNFLGSDVPVGSKFYRYICSHGEVIVEPCADFRQEECIENDVAGYSEAACRVNRWQDCTSIFTKSDCENTDQRDCTWMDGIEYVFIGGLGNGSTLDKSSLQAAKGELKKFKNGERELGGCVPRIPPGLQFWNANPGTQSTTTGTNGATTSTSSVGENTEAQGICSQANAICPVTYEKGIGGDWKCIKNCECLDEGEQLKRVQLCMAIGDCGPKVNIANQAGRKAGYKIFEEELKKKK